MIAVFYWTETFCLIEWTLLKQWVIFRNKSDTFWSPESTWLKQPMEYQQWKNPITHTSRWVHVVETGMIMMPHKLRHSHIRSSEWWWRFIFFSLDISTYMRLFVCLPYFLITKLTARTFKRLMDFFSADRLLNRVIKGLLSHTLISETGTKTETHINLMVLCFRTWITSINSNRVQYGPLYPWPSDWKKFKILIV